MHLAPKPEKRKLSKFTLEMKFMQRSKEKAMAEEENEQRKSLFDDKMTKLLKEEGSKYVMEDSFMVCEGVKLARFSFKGMNPEIEKMMREVLHPGEEPPPTDAKDVSDDEMAERYSSLVGTIGSKFTGKKTKFDSDSEEEEKDEPPAKKPRGGGKGRGLRPIFRGLKR